MDGLLRQVRCACRLRRCATSGRTQARRRGQAGAPAPDRSLYDAFSRAPSVPLAVSALKQETDPGNGWRVFERVLAMPEGARVRADVRFFQAMMSFCKRHLPAKAARVLEATAARGIPICDTLFGTFLGACLAANPPMVHDALDLYDRLGPRSHSTILGVAHVCRAAQQPSTALQRLVSDAVANGVDITEKLFSMFAACCAESRESTIGADTAERLLALVRRHTIAPHGNHRAFGNLIKALLAQDRVDAALDALQVMDAVGVPPSEHNFTHVLSVLAKQDRIGPAIDLFEVMSARRVPVGAPVLSALITAAGRCADQAAIEALHRYASDRSLLPAADDIVACALIYAYDRCGALAAAEDVFRARCTGDALPRLPTLNAMIAAYSHHGQPGKAIALFEGRVRQQAHLRLDLPMYTNVIGVLARSDRIVDAVDLFESMVSNDVHGAQAAAAAPVLCLLVSSCGRCFELSFLRRLHEYARGTPLIGDDRVASAFIAAYAVCGRLDVAEGVFRARTSSSSPPPNVQTFTSMISAYGHHGLLQEALSTFRAMKQAGVTPNEVTLLALLIGCGQAGDLDRANALVDEFAGAWRTPMRSSHTNCLIGLHGQMGRLSDAEFLAGDGDLSSWLAVLDACRKHRDVPRAERAFARVVSAPGTTGPLLTTTYTLLASVYAAAGRLQDVVRVQGRMRERGVLKPATRTTLMLETASVHFWANDNEFHADADLVRRHAGLIRDLGRLGYRPDPAWGTVPIDEHVGGASLARAMARSVCVHSEKIALAHAVSVLPADAPIHLARDLPTCPDCHDFAKRLSAGSRRPIRIRDQSRYHRIDNGECSCGDYW
ncbi:DYW domain-containing protein [Plasmodiophora brassicae]